MNQIPQETDYSMYLANTMEKVLDYTKSINSSNNEIAALILIQSFLQNITKSLFVNLDSSIIYLKFLLWHLIQIFYRDGSQGG